jgi:hypothetical protein
MSKLDILLDLYGDQFIIAVGFDKAIIGFDENSDRAIYSVKKIINVLMKDERMSYDDALEWYQTYMANGRPNNNNEPIYCNDVLL